MRNSKFNKLYNLISEEINNNQLQEYDINMPINIEPQQVSLTQNNFDYIFENLKYIAKNNGFILKKSYTTDYLNEMSLYIPKEYLNTIKNDISNNNFTGCILNVFNSNQPTKIIFFIQYLQQNGKLMLRLNTFNAACFNLPSQFINCPGEVKFNDNQYQISVPVKELYKLSTYFEEEFKIFIDNLKNPNKLKYYLNNIQL